MSSCDAICIELPALVTGELNDAQSATVEGHLVSCDHCRRELAQTRKVIGLVSRAPLEHAPPGNLASDVFTLLELEPVAAAVRAAPLEHEPPAILERRSMEHAGVVVPGPTRWQRTSAYLAPALAACLLIVGFLAFASDDEVPGEVGSSPGAGLSASGATDITFTQTSADSIWPEVDGTITERSDGTHALTVTFEDYPEVAGDESCRLDLVGADGERVTVAAFQVSEDNTESWTVTFPLPADPANFDSFEMSIEGPGAPGDGQPILEAPIRA